jgi:hypothetical protein
LIDYAEQQSLERICRYHGADNPELISHLASLIEWVHQSEQAQHGGEQPLLRRPRRAVLG